MKYEYECRNVTPPRRFTVDAPISKGPPAEVRCPHCDTAAVRVWTTVAVRYATQGFHSTDYDKHGDKLERFNDNWSKHYGEKPPPAAKDVPKNSTEPY